MRSEVSRQSAVSKKSFLGAEKSNMSVASRGSLMSIMERPEPAVAGNITTEGRLISIESRLISIEARMIRSEHLAKKAKKKNQSSCFSSRKH